MKILTVLAFGLSMQSPAADVTKTCIEIGEMAKSVMEARQNGVDIAKLLQISDSQKSDHVKKLTRVMIIDAYKTSRYSTHEYKKMKIEEFANSAIVACLQSYS